MRREDARSARWRDQLPAPLHRLLLAAYTRRPSARAFRRGLEDRRRVAALVHGACDGRVQRGPFAGMAFPFVSTDAAAKCVGSYERELHPEIERILHGDYRAVVNVGCAEGYYAVGFARAIPHARVYAFDSNPEAVSDCQTMARANGLTDDRITFGGEVTHQVLDSLSGPGVLVVADIEGGEAALLDPDRAPGLMGADMLVEVHEGGVPGVEALLRRRFADTHVVRHVDSEPRTDPSTYPELAVLEHEERLLALFERPIIMRWLLLQAKDSSGR